MAKSDEVEEIKPDLERKRKRKFIPIPRPAVKYKQSRITRRDVQDVEKEVYEKQIRESVEQVHKPERPMKFKREKKRWKISAPVILRDITKPKPQKIELPKIQTKRYRIFAIKNVDKLAKDIAQKIHIQKEIEGGYVDEKKNIGKVLLQNFNK